MFQFPTGWNSTVFWNLLVRLLEERFNSQRDGILPKLGITEFEYVKFQFPTGWNSTFKNDNFFTIASLFQFPTGWNSTLSCLRRRRSYWRFNSQRDGILLEFVEKCSNGYKGFNSQRDGILQTTPPASSSNSLCFNSQRDGILHKCGAYYKDDDICFNSQRDGILRRRKRGVFSAKLVSIPNGMEFYPSLQAQRPPF